jgi:hypothetical protein
MSEQNVYIQVHAKKIEKMLHDIEIYKMQGGYGGSLNLAEIQSIIRGLCNEVAKQRTEINTLQERILVNTLSSGQVDQPM